MFPSWSEYLYHSTYSNIYAVQFSLSLDVFLFACCACASWTERSFSPLGSRRKWEHSMQWKCTQGPYIQSKKIKKNNNPLHGRVKYWGARQKPMISCKTPWLVALCQICTSLPDLWEPLVMYLHCRLWAWKWKLIGAGLTGSEGPHHCRFVAWTGSVLAATHHCRFKPRADSDWALSLLVLAKNRRW